MIITAISPTSGTTGTSVTISGSGFGIAQGSQRVELDGITQTVTAWADDEITITVVAGSSSGNVRVVNGGTYSNGIYFSFAQAVAAAAPFWETRIYNASGDFLYIAENAA